MFFVFKGEVSSTSLHSDQLGEKNKNKNLNAVADVQFKKNVKFVALIFCKKN